MKKLTLLRLIPVALLGAQFMIDSYGAEVIQPENAVIRQTNKIFLGINHNELIGFGDSVVFQEFSSERLVYRFPGSPQCQEIINLVSLPEISRTLFSGTSDPHSMMISRIMNDFFRGNDRLKSRKTTEGVKNYDLPNEMIWCVSSKTDNQLIGAIFSEFISSYHAEKRAPEGELHEFYKNDMTNNTYVNVAYAVSPQHQRQGYATEMSLAVMGMFFQHSTADVIMHTSDENNIGSMKSADTCCFLSKGMADGEIFKILRKSSQLRLLEESKPSLTEALLQLESLVFDLIKENDITMNLLDTSNVNNRPGMAYCLGSSHSKLPQNLEELRNWCAKGYQLGENENFNSDTLTNPRKLLSTAHYSFRLFCYGIHNDYLPLIRYVLEYYNNIWERKDLSDELIFSLHDNSYTMITYLIKRDFISIFDYLIQNKDFRSYTFGSGIKNGMGNTPFHTLAKYGSLEMLQRFLREKELVNLCLNSENIAGENGMNPLQIAQSVERLVEIINVLSAVVPIAEK